MRLRKLIAITLIFSLVLTLFPSNLVYADPGVIGSSGGSQHLSSGGSNNVKLTWNEIQQGVRVSIVDKDGNNVLRDAHAGYNGIDILFKDPGSYGKIINTYEQRNKFDLIDGNYIRLQWSTVKNYLIESASNHPMKGVSSVADNLKTGDLAKPMRKGTDGNFYGNGLATKAFFVSGDIEPARVIGAQSSVQINAGDLVIGSSTGGTAQTSGNLFI